jgi:hypothetical protein
MCDVSGGIYRPPDFVLGLKKTEISLQYPHPITVATYFTRDEIDISTILILNFCECFTLAGYEFFPI